MITLSPSAVAKFRMCERLYAYEYNEGHYPPTSPKQQFGLDVHKQLEQWLKQAKPPNNFAEGLTAKQGIQKGWLPTPDPRLLIEHRFSFPIFEGVSAGGIIDCVAPPGVACVEPLVIDHKTTSDLRWAKTEEQLADDPQALMYGIWAMLTWSSPVIKVRWIYYAATNPTDGKPRKPRGAKPVEVILDSQSPEFMDHATQLLVNLERMAEIRRGKLPGLKFQPTPESCGHFGGCPHAGRCNLSANDKLAAFMNRGSIV